MRDVFIILNERAGTLSGLDPESAKRQIADALSGAGRRIDIMLASGRAIAQAIDRAAADRYDTLIVGGGDGSVSYAAAKLAGSERTLGVLPLGTMNLLGRDLGMPDDLPGMLKALATSRPRRIDLATLNGRPFHSISGIGFFSQMARAREEVRSLPGRIVQVGAAALRAFRRTGRFTLAIDIDGRSREIDTYALLITCNRFGGADWRRAALDGGMLEIHIARDKHAIARLKDGADLITGSWRDNDGIESIPAGKVTIRARRQRAYVATDGERNRETMPLCYELRPRALSVLMPD